MCLSVLAVTHDPDGPEEMRVKSEKYQQQPDDETRRDRSTAERAGAERMTHDQVALTRDRHDQPDWVVAYLYTQQLMPVILVPEIGVENPYQRRRQIQ